jgi:hypothetical protein
MGRLEALVRGLGLEESLWRKCSVPVLAVDRIEYMTAIGEAIKALDKARVIVAKMICEIAENKTRGVS